MNATTAADYSNPFANAARAVSLTTEAMSLGRTEAQLALGFQYALRPETQSVGIFFADGASPMYGAFDLTTDGHIDYALVDAVGNRMLIGPPGACRTPAGARPDRATVTANANVPLTIPGDTWTRIPYDAFATWVARHNAVACTPNDPLIAQYSVVRDASPAPLDPDAATSVGLSAIHVAAPSHGWSASATAQGAADSMAAAAPHTDSRGWQAALADGSSTAVEHELRGVRQALNALSTQAAGHASESAGTRVVMESISRVEDIAEKAAGGLAQLTKELGETTSGNESNHAAVTRLADELKHVRQGTEEAKKQWTRSEAEAERRRQDDAKTKKTLERLTGAVAALEGQRTDDDLRDKKKLARIQDDFKQEVTMLKDEIRRVKADAEPDTTHRLAALEARLKTTNDALGELDDPTKGGSAALRKFEELLEDAKREMARATETRIAELQTHMKSLAASPSLKKRDAEAMVQGLADQVARTKKEYQDSAMAHKATVRNLQDQLDEVKGGGRVSAVEQRVADLDRAHATDLGVIRETVETDLGTAQADAADAKRLAGKAGAQATAAEASAADAKRIAMKAEQQATTAAKTRQQARSDPKAVARVEGLDTRLVTLEDRVRRSSAAMTELTAKHEASDIDHSARFDHVTTAMEELKGELLGYLKNFEARVEEAFTTWAGRCTRNDEQIQELKKAVAASEARERFVREQRPEPIASATGGRAGHAPAAATAAEYGERLRRPFTPAKAAAAPDRVLHAVHVDAYDDRPRTPTEDTPVAAAVARPPGPHPASLHAQGTSFGGGVLADHPYGGREPGRSAAGPPPVHGSPSPARPPRYDAPGQRASSVDPTSPVDPHNLRWAELTGIALGESYHVRFLGGSANILRIEGLTGEGIVASAAAGGANATTEIVAWLDAARATWTAKTGPHATALQKLDEKDAARRVVEQSEEAIRKLSRTAEADSVRAGTARCFLQILELLTENNTKRSAGVKGVQAATLEYASRQAERILENAMLSDEFSVKEAVDGLVEMNKVLKLAETHAKTRTKDATTQLWALLTEKRADFKGRERAVSNVRAMKSRLPQECHVACDTFAQEVGLGKGSITADKFVIDPSVGRLPPRLRSHVADEATWNTSPAVVRALIDRASGTVALDVSSLVTTLPS